MCRDILEKYFGVPVEITPKTNDGGRDLIIHFSDGIAYVECKHYLNSTVSRPVVQKLVGAMYNNAPRGMVITSGRFSDGAIDYVLSNGHRIKLVDLMELKRIANDVGYSLIVSDSDKTSIEQVHVVSNSIFEGQLRECLKRQINSSPADVGSSTRLLSRSLQLLPYYEVSYDLDAVFSTSVGTIHRETDSGSVFIDFNTKKVSDWDFSICFVNSVRVPYDPNNNVCSTFSGCSLNDLKSIALRRIIDDHTKDVSYRGRNNTCYHKHCVPKDRDVLIKGINLIYIPFSQISYQLLGRTRRMSIAETGRSDFFICKGSELKCDLSNIVSHPLQLCNDCSNLSTIGNGKLCSVCGKTLCDNCSFYYRKYLFFKRYICKSCGSKNNSLKIKSLKIL